MSTISSIYNEQVGIEVFSKTNETGLKIYVIPTGNEDFVKTDIIVGIGGQDKKYVDRITGKVKEIPAGIAHYIEHLMFYEKNVKDVMQEFEKIGAYSNAYTYIDRTVFTAEANSKTYINSLRKLMKMIFVPYFTKRTLAKEKKIVSSEMDINENPESVISFVEDTDVIGVKENLDKVNPRILYNIYENYYTPNNMAIVVYGGVKLNDVLKNIDEMVLKLNLTNKPKVVKCELEKNNLNNVKVLKKDRKNPSEIEIGLDFSKVAQDKNKVKFNIVQNILLETNFTKLSDFVFELEDEDLIERMNIIDENLESCYYSPKDFMIIKAKTKHHEKIKEKLIEHLNKVLEIEPSEEDFRIAKNAMYVRILRELLDDIVQRVEDVFLYDYKIFEDLDLLQEMTFDEYKRAIKEMNLKDLKMYLVYYI